MDFNSDSINTDVLKSILSALPYMVFLFDKEGRIIFFNQKVVDCLDGDMEEFIGKKWDDLDFSQTTTKINKQIIKVLQTHRTQSGKITLSLKKGLKSFNYVFNIIKPDKGSSIGVLAVLMDSNQLKNISSDENLNEVRLKAMIRLYEMSDCSLGEITDYALEQLVEITGSKLGYLSFLNETEDLLTMYSWSKEAMKKCEINDKPIYYPVHETGLWGEAIRQRKPIIINDFKAPNKLKKGYPKGHVHLKRHMNVPIFDGDKIVVLAGVGNKKEAYIEEDITQIRILMNFLWSIIKRKNSEKALRNTLNEKEVMLNEIHHRVKNNLQVISSLLALQADFMESNEAKNVLLEARGRVKSMAMTHDKFYHADDLSKINFSQYLRELVDDILISSLQDSKLINLQIELDYSLLNLEIALPLGLIVNEILTNSLKHAFVESEEKIISIYLNKNYDEFELILKDNGVGFPKDIDYRNTNTMGMQLVMSLIMQIGAQIELNINQGTEFIIKFKNEV